MTAAHCYICKNNMFIIINICFQSVSVAINTTLICFLISLNKLPPIWEIQSSVFQDLAKYIVLQTRQKLLNFFYPMNWLAIYFCQSSKLWVSLLLEDQRQRAHFETICFLEFDRSEEKQLLLMVAIYSPYIYFQISWVFCRKQNSAFLSLL